MTFPVIKRANPNFIHWDQDGADPSQIGKIQIAVGDAYLLAAFASRYQSTFPDIWDKYFPEHVDGDSANIWNEVSNLYLAITPDASQAHTGGPLMSDFNFDGVDSLKGGGENDVWALGGDGYTFNIRLATGQQQADCHICEESFDEDPLYLQGHTCEDFKFNNGRYRLTRDMNVLGATILHEMTHFNALANAVHVQNLDPNDESNFGSFHELIWDIQTTPGSPLSTRALRESNPAGCTKNAESYVWLALETYYTVTCWNELQENGQSRFDAPLK